ncbi:MAG: TerC/Alx family metal homeostasis membrane protein [Chitinophagaceae bacterium]|nr:MAG: TerC/Alx family metal homeostasis membrane protein [Chitinophagaceae bacterium]
MSPDQSTYLVFGIVLVLAVIFDLGLLSKKSTTISIKRALWQTVFWVILAMAFFGYLWYQNGQTTAFEYLSAYLMEWSLSIDNIFVFILIFSFFGIKEIHVARALLIGILMAVIFRVIFITVGVVLVEKFEWLLYLFGAFLVFTGIRIFTVRQEDDFDPVKNPVYKYLKKVVNITAEDTSGRFMIKKDGKRFYTNMFVVIILLATTDIVFALDSIPAVFAISQDRLVIYTSNIFAVLGLRSLFFLLKGAINKFEYLQQGIAIVLIFIGLKMLVEIFHIRVPVFVSLMVIIVCLVGSIVYSIQENTRRENNE